MTRANYFITSLQVSSSFLVARDKKSIMQVLVLSDNKISGAGGAAEMLGMKPTTLASRLKNMDIHI